MTYEIKRGVPIPRLKLSGFAGRKPYYDFDKLGIGDCIEEPLVGNVKDSTRCPDKAATRLRNAATWYKKKHPGWDYTSRTCPDGFARCWRMA